LWQGGVTKPPPDRSRSREARAAASAEMWQERIALKPDLG
jgi:hypothetical protein